MFGLFGGGGAKISVDEVKSGLAAGTVVLVDVRDAAELHMTGTAKDAVNIPLSVLQDKCDPNAPSCLPEMRDKSVKKVLFCASGARSAMAVRQLQKLGHTDVANLGGLHNWASGRGDIVNVAK